MQLLHIKVRQFLQMLLTEDFRTVFNYAVQRLTIPLFNVHYIFENDLTRAHELNDPGRPLPQGFAIRIFRGENEIGPIADKLRRAGATGAVLTERTKRGDLVAILFDEEDEVAAYTWATFTDAWMKEVRATLLLGRDETFGVDTFVLPRWRGKRLQIYPRDSEISAFVGTWIQAQPELGKCTQHAIAQDTGERTQATSGHCLQCSDARRSCGEEIFSRRSYQGPERSAMAERSASVEFLVLCPTNKLHPRAAWLCKGILQDITLARRLPARPLWIVYRQRIGQRLTQMRPQVSIVQINSALPDSFRQLGT